MPRGGARPNSGPKKKPTALHERDGTKRAYRTNFDEPAFTAPAVINRPPPELDEIASEWWMYHAPLFNEAGVLTKADVSLLVAAAVCWSEFRRASDVIKGEQEMTVDTRMGCKADPHFGMASKSLNDYLTIVREFGVGPASRTKVVAKREAENDEFEEMFA